MDKDNGLSRRAVMAAGLTGGAAALGARAAAATETAGTPPLANVCRMMPRMV